MAPTACRALSKCCRPNSRDTCACVAVHRSRRSTPAWCAFTRLFPRRGTNMPDIERSWLTIPARRTALARLAGFMAASPIAAAGAQTDPRPLSEHRRALSLAEMQTAFDFEPVFFGNVPVRTYDYTAHGDGSEFTLRRNRQAFDWVDIVPARAAVPASQIDLSSELLSVKMKFPIIVAPTAAMVPLHPDGEIGMFKAATAASNTLMILSINTG